MSVYVTDFNAHFCHKSSARDRYDTRHEERLICMCSRCELHEGAAEYKFPSNAFGICVLH
jgi:hypothetical protein